MDRKGESKVWVWVLVAAIGIYLIAPGFYSNLFASFSGASAPAAAAASAAVPTTAVSGVVQTSVDKVTVSFKTWDRFSPSASVSNGSHRVFVNGKDNGWFNDGGSFTAAPGDTVKIYYALNSTGWYPKVDTVVLPQTKGTYLANTGLARMDVAPTINVLDWNGALVSSTNVQPVNANDVKTTTVRVVATSKRAFGDPDVPGLGNIACFKGNSTDYTSLALSGMPKAFTPTTETVGAGTKIWCYYFPVVVADPSNSAGAIWQNPFVITSGNTNPTGAEGNITIDLFDTGVVLNTNTAAEIDSVEDDQGTRVGSTQTQTATLGVS